MSRFFLSFCVFAAQCNIPRGSDDGRVCPGLGNPNLIVLVRAADGTEVCDARVELLDGSGGVVGQVPPFSPGILTEAGTYACSYEYMGLNGRFGVRARKDASVSDTQQIDVAADECNQPTKPRATITLSLT